MFAPPHTLRPSTPFPHPPFPHTTYVAPAPAVAAWGTNLGDMEWDGPDTVGALYWQFQEEMKQQGQRHLLVTAAGNHGRQLREQKDCRSFFFMPAQLKLGNMVVVGATGGAAGVCVCVCGGVCVEVWRRWRESGC